MPGRAPVFAPPSGRRRFLTTAAGAAASLLVAGRAGWADAPAPAASGRRSLSFLNTHTGESVSAGYWADGEYRADGLAPIDRVLRDHRTGDVRSIDPPLHD